MGQEKKGGGVVQSKRLASAISINKRLAGNALAVALVAFWSSCAGADILTYTATGPVVNASASLQQFLGQPSTFTFTLNTAIPDQDPRPLNGLHLGGLVSSSGSVGSYQFSTGAGPVWLGKLPSYDVFATSTMSVTGPSIGGAHLVAAGIELYDFTKTSFFKRCDPFVV